VCQCFGTLDIHVLSGEKAGERALNYPAADRPRRSRVRPSSFNPRWKGASSGAGPRRARRSTEKRDNRRAAVASAILMTAESERRLRSKGAPMAGLRCRFTETGPTRVSVSLADERATNVNGTNYRCSRCLALVPVRAEPDKVNTRSRGMPAERDTSEREFRVSFLHPVFFLSSPRSERISC